MMQDDIKALLGFLGYGNPAGRFWFIGIEEAGASGDEDNRKEHEARLQFKEIEDLPSAEGRLRQALGKPPNMSKLRPTWATMCRFMMRIDGNANWRDREAVRDHQSTRLGLVGDESFLTEVLPLRKAQDDKWDGTWWPFNRWKDWQDYCDSVRPARFERLRQLLDQHRPDFVFWYGNWFWREYRAELIPALRPRDLRKIAGSSVEIGTLGPTTLVFTPFFGFRTMPMDLIDTIAVELGF